MDVKQLQSYISGVFEDFKQDSLPEIILTQNQSSQEYKLIDLEVSYQRHGHTTHHKFTIAHFYDEQQVRRAVDINMVFLETKWDMENFYQCLHPMVRHTLKDFYPDTGNWKTCMNNLQLRLVWILGRAGILSTRPINGFKNLEYKINLENGVQWEMLRAYAASENYQ